MLFWKSEVYYSCSTINSVLYQRSKLKEMVNETTFTLNLVTGTRFENIYQPSLISFMWCFNEFFSGISIVKVVKTWKKKFIFHVSFNFFQYSWAATINHWLKAKYWHCTKMMFSINSFFIKCDQISSFLWIWSHLLNKLLMEDFCFCAV